jgi:hypothetical protein
MKQLTMFIKNNMGQMRSAKYEVRNVNEVRSAKCEVRNVNEIRNDSSLRGTKQSLQLFFLRLPVIALAINARNDVTIQHLKSKIQNPKFLFILSRCVGTLYFILCFV